MSFILFSLVSRRVQQILSFLLIGLLCFEAIFRVPFLIRPASALEFPRHEDLVSIIVEEGIYDELRDEIQQYAQRIQSKLPDTRALIFPVTSDTHPYVIHLLNERLYFSGEPDRSDEITQKLAGTILIGDVSLPVVTKQGASFKSIYPYVDFDEPHFFFDSVDERFEYIDESRDHPEADVWHSVIRPNTGDQQQDALKVKTFFERVYEFDSQTGRYENVFDDPQVLYLDSYREAKAIIPGKWQTYRQITLAYIDHLIYHRFSGLFAQYVTETFTKSLESQGTYEAPHFNDWSGRDESVAFLDHVGDITTKHIFDEMVPEFIDVINEKFLGDIGRFVHNTGRYYNGRSEVRMDTLPELITKKDLAAREFIRQINEMYQGVIRELVETKLARDIAVLTQENVSQTIREVKKNENGDNVVVSRTYQFVYDNFFYGDKSSGFSAAPSCSLTRGSEFRPGESSIVEANRGHSVTAPALDNEMLARDAEDGIVCPSDPDDLTRSYWGGNSALNASFPEGVPTLGSHHYGSFTSPIFDITGSKRIGPGSPLGISQPTDCFSNHLIMRPYYHNGVARDYYWPVETDGSRYSCQTNIGGSIPSPFSLPVTQTFSMRFEDVVDRCGDDEDATVRLLGRDGSLQATCSGTGRRLTFKRIRSPVYHTSPTDSEYGQQLQAISAPNLPIDAHHYVSFIGLHGQQVRHYFPDLFDIDLGPSDTIETIEQSLEEYFAAESGRLNTLISQLDPRSLDQSEKLFALQLSQLGSLGNYPSADMDLLGHIRSDPDIYAQLLDTLDWIRLDSVPEKYDRALTSYLDYQGTVAEQLTDPSQKTLYEIAYIGGLGNPENLFLDMFPEAANTPQQVVDILAQQSDVADIIHQEIAQVDRQISAFDPRSSSVVTDLANRFTPSRPEVPEDTSARAYALTSEQQRHLTEGGESQEDPFGGCGGTDGVVIWDYAGATGCWIEGQSQISHTSENYAGDTSVFDEYVDYVRQPFANPYETASGGADYNIYSSVVSQDAAAAFFQNSVSEESVPDPIPFVFSDLDHDGVPDVYSEERYALVLSTQNALLGHQEGANFRIHVQDEEGVQVNDNVSRVQVEVIRIDDLSSESSRVVRPGDVSDWHDTYADYVTLLQSPVTLSRGSNSTLVTSSDKDANIYVRANIVDVEGNSKLSSGILRLRIRDKNIQVISKATDVTGDFSVSNSYDVGDEAGVSFRFFSRDPDMVWRGPMSVHVLDDLSGATLYATEGVGLQGDTYHMHFDTHRDLLTQSGSHTFVFTDASGKTARHTMSFLPAQPASIDLVGNRVLISDTHNVLTLMVRDVYGNISRGHTGTVRISTSDDVRLSSAGRYIDTASAFELDISSGKVPLRLLPRSSGNVHIEYLIEGEGISTVSHETHHRVVDEIVLRTELLGEQELRVGGQSRVLSVRATDGAGQFLDDFSAVIPVGSDRQYIHVDAPIQIRNGRGQIPFITDVRTTESTSLSTQTDGKIYFSNDPLRIRSAQATGLRIVSDANEFLSSHQSQANVYVSVYDRYGNEYDGYETYQVVLSSPDEHLLELPTDRTLDIISGKTQAFVVAPKQRGGIAYLYAHLQDAADQDVLATRDVSTYTIHHGLNRESIAPLNLNTLTTYLLGGAYGDVTHPDYVAGAFLYENDAGKNLSVTTLVDDPYFRETWFRLEPTGRISASGNSTGILGPITHAYVSNGFVQVDIIDPLTQRRLGRVSPRFTTQDFVYRGCTSDALADDTCGDVPVSSYVFLSTFDGLDLSADEGGMYVTDGQRERLRVQADGRIFGDVDRVELTESTRGGLGLNLFAGSDFLGYLEIYDGNEIIQIDQEGALPVESGMYVQVCEDCLTRAVSTGSSSRDPKALEIMPSASLVRVSLDQRYVGGGVGQGYSSYLQTAGIGWEGDDLGILDFAGSMPIAEASQVYDDYLTIHLGDPLVTLDTKRNYSHGFDRTIGERIFTSRKRIHDLDVRDINDDNIQDLFVFHDDGTIALRLDPAEANQDIGDIASILDMDEEKKGLGDFFGDKYPDLVFATDNGLLQILENNAGVFVRSDLKFSEDVDLGPVMHLRVFDMDADDLDDVIVVDRFGSLFIFYGDTSGTFQAQFIENAFSLSLDDLQTSEYFTGSVRYEGAGGIGEGQLTADDTLIESLVYDVVTSNGSRRMVTRQTDSLGDEVVDLFDVDEQGFFRMDDRQNPTNPEDIRSAFDTIQSRDPDAIRIVEGTSEHSAAGQRFLKSPFIRSDVLKITKQFVGESTSDIAFGDEIEVILRIKNASNQTLRNIQILDDNPAILTLSDEPSYEFKINDEVPIIREYELHSGAPVSGLFDLSDTPLIAGDEIEIRYTLEVRSFEYGELLVGHLETSTDPDDSRKLGKDEVRTIQPELVSRFATNPDLTLSESEFVGIEKFGDIVFYPNEDCGRQYFLWRSHNEYERTYHKTFRGINDTTDTSASRLSQSGSSPYLAGSPLCTGDGAHTPSAQPSFRSSPRKAQTKEQDLSDYVQKFPAGLSWDYRPNAPVSIGDRNVYVVDLFEVSGREIVEFHQAGKLVVCAFTVGTLVEGPQGQGLSLADTLPTSANLHTYLDITSPRVRGVMAERILLAARTGCDGILGDHIDGYAHDTKLTEKETHDYLSFLSSTAHERGLAFGFKNAPELIDQAQDDMDFALVERCHETADCDVYDAFIQADKSVFSVEYELSCSQEPEKFSNIVCDVGLDSECDQCTPGLSSIPGVSVGTQPVITSEHSRSAPSPLTSQFQSTLSGGNTTSPEFVASRGFGDHSTRQAQFAAYTADSDGDQIPDRHDDRHGSFLSLDQNGTIRIGQNIGNYVDGVSQLLNKFISGLSCGFGDSGCISLPINWTANIPGDTLTFMGFALPFVNKPPFACFKDVRCGYPIFAYPTGKDRNDTWPPEPYGAGGAFDYEPSVTGAIAGEALKQASPAFVGGKGISRFRLFLGFTLTGAIAETVCFGPNNITNPVLLASTPTLFPFNFVGNCIFSTQPLFQCQDDGQDEDPGSFTFQLDPRHSSVQACIDNDLIPGSQNSLVANTPSRSGRNSSSSRSQGKCQTGLDPEVLATVKNDVIKLLYSGSPRNSATSQAVRDAITLTLSQHPELLTNPSSTSTSTPIRLNSKLADPIDRLNSEPSIGLALGSGGSGVNLGIGLGPGGLKYQGFDVIKNIDLSSIRAFPGFLMNWFQDQIDEVVSSLGDLPDMRVVLPELSGITDPGWIKSLGSGVGQAYRQGVNSVQRSQGASSGSSTRGGATPSCSGGGCALSDIGGAIQGVGQSVSNSKPVQGLRQQYAGLQASFEYINSLPIINVQPDIISAQLPWMPKGELNAWLVRNKAILQSWKDIKGQLAGLFDASGLIASIEANIATVESYLTLPQKLQEYLHWKEKYLYEVLANIQAVQGLMGGWLYENGQRFKSWAETFILVTKLWDSWQAIIDIFLNYDIQCGVCRNERWNLQHWMWKIIGAIIPDIPVIKMPRWPDIGLDFSNIDLNLDIAYPVLDFDFHPVNLPDSPEPGFGGGFSAPSVSQLPQVPNLPNLPDTPQISVPQLPNLPPAPKIPGVSAAISTVVDIFKIVTLIMCLYRQVPLSPEWYVGTKLAHKTERQGYLPFDFLTLRLPSPQISFLDKIDISTNVGLSYDLGFLSDALRQAISPLSNLPRNFARYGDSIPSQVTIQVGSAGDEDSQMVQMLTRLADLIDELDGLQGASMDVETAYTQLDEVVRLLKQDATGMDPKMVAHLIDIAQRPDLAWLDDYIASVTGDAEERFDSLIAQVDEDLATTQQALDDLYEVMHGDAELTSVPFFADDIQTQFIQTSQSSSAYTPSSDYPERTLAFLDGSTVSTASLVVQATQPTSVSSPEEQNDSDYGPIPYANEGIYLMNKYGRTQRISDYTAGQNEQAMVMTDVDGDGDIDVLYARQGAIYLKRHQGNQVLRRHIQDRIRIYTLADVFEKFLRVEDLEGFEVTRYTRFLQSSGFPPERLSASYLSDDRRSHMRFVLDTDLFGQMKKRGNQKTRVTYDVMDREGYFTDELGLGDVLLMRKIPAYIERARGVFRFSGPTKKMTLTKNNRYVDHETAESGRLDGRVRIRPSQRIYTSSGDALVVAVYPDGESERLRLPSHREIIVRDEIELEVLRGQVVLMGLSSSETNLRASEIRDHPIMEGTTIRVLDNSQMTVAFDDGSHLDVSEGSRWELLASSKQDSTVTIRGDLENGFYHGVQVDVRDEEPERRIQRQALFAPQNAADIFGVEASIPEAIDVSALTTSSIDFSEYVVFDDTVLVELRVLQEESGENNPNSFKRTSNTAYSFGPFDSLDPVSLELTFFDGAGNATTYYTKLQPEVPYVGVHDVSLDEGKLIVDGSVHVDALSSDIQIHRFDEDGSGPVVATRVRPTEDGDFRLSVTLGDQYDQLVVDDEYIAKVEKNTGRIYALGENYTVVFEPAASERPSAFVLLGAGNKEVYRFEYQLNNPILAQIQGDRDVSELREGIYLRSSTTRLVKASLDDPSIPDGAYVVNDDGSAIFAIDTRGQIYALTSDVGFDYDGEGQLRVTFEKEGVGGELVFVADGVVVSR